jgi:hypothetical protein
MREALETDTRLSTAEVKQALETMSPADWRRVERLAKLAFAGMPAVSHEDLLQEACTKLLSGERVWHRGFAAVPAIASVLDSMASNHRKREANGPIDAGAVVESADAMDAADLLVRSVEPVQTVTPGGYIKDLIAILSPTTWSMAASCSVARENSLQTPGF